MKQYYSSENTPGAEHWMDLQYKEEIMHAEDFIDFIESMGEEITLGDIEKVETEYESYIDPFIKGLEHEKIISQSIRDLMDIAVEEKNYEAQDFLRVYISEQVEEEENFNDQIDLIKRAGNDLNALFTVDDKLGARVQETISPAGNQN